MQKLKISPRTTQVLKNFSSINPSIHVKPGKVLSTISAGKTIMARANVEEDFADNAVWTYGLLPRDTHVMPWRIEDRLRALGANFVQAGLWRSFAVRDGDLITGQQNFSGEETARAVVSALGR